MANPTTPLQGEGLEIETNASLEQLIARELQTALTGLMSRLKKVIQESEGPSSRGSNATDRILILSQAISSVMTTIGDKVGRNLAPVVTQSYRELVDPFCWPGSYEEFQSIYFSDREKWLKITQKECIKRGIHIKVIQDRTGSDLRTLEGLSLNPSGLSSLWDLFRTFESVKTWMTWEDFKALSSNEQKPWNEILKKRGKELGLTQADAAKILGLHNTHLSRIWTKEHKLSEDKLERYWRLLSSGIVD